ncbi:anti-sigma factor domain-containing protein [Neobacillus terrae]|uniref:anti-sigma factor domain-containing protein n=1 Tax=Neobacillus terrae TaxID=3034837 RepID=UPI00140A2DE5|nr:anti-sigma factor domain-containing protein [Neobacillus terrae]NHM29549.1 anti-sigma factor domain-containing protein [Neobacillus terrae]
MKKGIIMEIDDVFLTLLTPDGEFLRARKQPKPYVLGEEVHFYPLEVNEGKKRSISLVRFLKGKVLLSAAAAIFLLAASYVPLYKGNQAYAYMSIDVNPSIELALNKKMQVLELTPFNKDGKKIVKNLNDWQKRDVAAVAEQILNEIKKQGYTKSKSLVVISTVRAEKSEKNAEIQLTENLQEIKETIKKDDLEIAVVKGNKRDLQAAHEQGMTAGKYKEKSIPIRFEKKKDDKPTIKDKSKEAAVTEQPQITPPSVPPSVPAVPAVPAPPPGQLKKELNAQPQTSNAVKPSVPAKVKPVPPGQIKKNNGQQIRQNHEVNHAPEKKSTFIQKPRSNPHTAPGQVKKYGSSTGGEHHQSGNAFKNKETHGGQEGQKHGK